MEYKLSIVKKYVQIGYRVAFVLRVCGVSSSTWYYHIKREKASPAPKKARGRPLPGYSYDIHGSIVLDNSILYLLDQFRKKPEFQNGGGCKIIPHYFKRDYGIIINHKKVYRLCKQHNLLLPRNKKKIKKNTKVCINRVINSPNKLWQFDIKYGYIHGENRFFYLLAFIDIFTKDIVNYHIGLSCKAKDLKITYEQALSKFRKLDPSKLVIRSDNGPQMTSNQFKEYIEGSSEHEFIPPGCPNKKCVY